MNNIITPPVNILIISHNTARANIVTHTMLELARTRKTDILLVQEPFFFCNDLGEIGLPQYSDY